jgi:GNAT superfamily N-acetyltransferase
VTAPARRRRLRGFSTDTVRVPWSLHLDVAVLTVRGARPQDLAGVALMHRRCSAKSLLDRYRAGGRFPAIVVLDRHVRDPLSFVVTTDSCRVLALACVAPDPTHSFGSAEISVLVEDDWQQMGIGRALINHSAAAAALAGYRKLISYPGTTDSTVLRLMSGVGTTRVMADKERHLHTAMPDSARSGLFNEQSATAPVAVGAAR